MRILELPVCVKHRKCCTVEERLVIMPVDGKMDGQQGVKASSINTLRLLNNLLVGLERSATVADASSISQTIHVPDKFLFLPDDTV